MGKHHQVVVATSVMHGAKKARYLPEEKVAKYIIYHSFEFISTKFHRFFAWFQIPVIRFLLRRIIRNEEPDLAIIAYPDLYMLDIASKTCDDVGLKYVPYLHDTIVEGVYDKNRRIQAQVVQDRLFSNNRPIAVMSKGMQTLYREKYKVKTISWEHIYPESIRVNAKGAKKHRAHWSGDVYEINHIAVKQLHDALGQIGMEMTISNGKSRDALKSFGLNGSHVNKVYYPKRRDYLEHLEQSKILLLALNEHDECAVHKDELSTIFSTKTPEYLASNSLILYYGSTDYFLAKFIKEHDCGIVLSPMSPMELECRITSILNDITKFQYKIENAKRTLKLFKAESVMVKVNKVLTVSK